MQQTYYKTADQLLPIGLVEHLKFLPCDWMLCNTRYCEGLLSVHLFNVL